MQQMNKITLACLLALSSGAHAWTVGNEGTATFSGQITGDAAVTWEVESSTATLGNINVNDFNKVGSTFVYKGKAPAADPLFHIRLKEAAKVTQLYDQITIAYLDKDGNPLTPVKVGPEWNGTFDLVLPATSATQPATAITLDLPLQTDSLIRLLTLDGTKYADLGSASFEADAALFDGMGCPQDKTCWLGQKSFGSKDPRIPTHVESKLSKVGANLTIDSTSDNNFLELKFADIGAKAKPDSKIGHQFINNAFTVKDTRLVGAASLLIDNTRDLTLTADKEALNGDWSAVLTVQVTNM